MKRKNKKIEVFVCEICGNPISPYAVKCKWCKKVLRPEYYKNKQNSENNNDKNKENTDVSETI